MSRRRILPLLVGAAGLSLFPGAPAEATPLACLDDCVIQAHFLAYIAPVTEIADGASVQWASLDVSHPTGELQGDSCFRAEMAGEQASAAVTFDIVDGGVVATSASLGTKPCESAFELVPGAHALPYRCFLHPNMVAALVVSR